MSDPSKLEQLPVSYQALVDYLDKQQPAKLFSLRMETFSRIEKLTGVPLICYVAKTLHLSPGLPAYIDDGDITGFSDLV
jgi:hypothetical protein